MFNQQPSAMKNLHPLIESNPAIMFGKPVIKDTRLTVELIIESLAAGESMEDMLEAYPRLTRAGILAALPFEKGVGIRPSHR